MLCGIVLVLSMSLSFQSPAAGPPKTGRGDDTLKETARPNRKAADTPSSLPVPKPLNESHNSSSGPETDNGEHPVKIVSIPQVQIESRKDRYDKIVVLCTALLVLLGGFQVFYLWRTVIVARDAAVAARASADALINSERAWIMVDIEHHNDKWADRKVHMLEGSGWGGNTTSFFGVLVCRNEGKSPAWVDEKRAKFEIVDSLPDTPRLESTEIIQVGPEPIGIGEALPREVRSPWIPEAIGHQELGKISVVYGVVRYRDIFDRRHETVFGYRITPSGEFVRIENRPEYNKNT